MLQQCNLGLRMNVDPAGLLSAESADAHTLCSQVALLESVKQSLLLNFNKLPYFQVYFHNLGVQLWIVGSQSHANGCATRFARRSSLHSKRFCHQLIVSPSKHGLPGKGIPTEIG